VLKPFSANRANAVYFISIRNYPDNITVVSKSGQRARHSVWG